MRSTFKILFYINRQKTKADGNTAILCRITIDGKSTAITTGEECKVSEWNSKQGLTTNRKTNQRINEFRELIEKTYRDILTRDGVVSVELIKNSLQGIATNPTTLLAMSKAELQAVKESVGKSRTEGTYLTFTILIKISEILSKTKEYKTYLSSPLRRVCSRNTVSS